MKYALVFAVVIASVSLLAFAGCRDSARADAVVPDVAATPAPGGNAAVSNDDVFDGKKIVKTDAEWKAEINTNRPIRSSGRVTPSRHSTTSISTTTKRAPTT